MNRVTVLFFATLKASAGTNRVEIDLPHGATIGDLKDQLAKTLPALATNLSHALASINQQFAFENDPIPEGAEVAFFPPVSGGGEPVTVFRITEEEVDLNELVAQITTQTTGAVSIFTGVVRAVTTRGEHYQTALLEYEAYKPMAEAKMAQVAREIRQQWPEVEGIVIVQRIGELRAGTPTVLIACSAGHRDSGVFEAARYGIDRLKEIVPIWKKEIGPHGQAWVEGSYHPQPGD